MESFKDGEQIEMDLRTEAEVRASMEQKIRKSRISGESPKLDDRETALFLKDQDEKREERNREYRR